MWNNSAFAVLVMTGLGLLGLVVPVAKPAYGIAPAAPLVISEFRLRGPGAGPAGTDDEFIEVYNTSSTAHTVASSSGSGYAVVASGAKIRFSIPDGTVIPAFGHFLGVNSDQYSLGTAATGDATWTGNTADNAGLALFNNNVVGGANFTLANRIDAVGSSAELDPLYREGAGYPALTNPPLPLESTFYRRQDNNNAVLDSDDNANDFLFADTAGTPAGAGQRLGAPGPENLSSPPFHGAAKLAVTPLDPGAGPMAAPNYVRDTTANPAQNSTFGTIALRRLITNNTGAPVTRLRIRLSDVSTLPAVSGMADLRARTSTDAVVALTAGGSATARSTTLGQPPTQSMGGGFNSTLSVGSVTPAAPLANGASVSVNLLFGVQQKGLWRLGLEADTLPGGGVSLDYCGQTDPTVPRPSDSCTQPPINTVPPARAVVGDTTFTGGALKVTDYDEDTSSKVTLTATHGLLTLSTTGLTFSTGDGSQDPTMTFTGTLTDINNALSTLVYGSTAGYTGPALLTITSDDQGRTWPLPHVGVTDPAATDTDTVALSVTQGGDFYPLAPTRILDTRTGVGAPAGRVGPGGVVTLDVTGAAGVPATGVSSVVVNVTETANTAGGFVTAWPSGTALPSTSNLLFGSGQTKAMLMTVGVGPDGNIALRNQLGQTHLIVDILGWTSTSSITSGGGSFVPLPSKRVVDTRTGTGTPRRAIPANSAITVQLTGSNGVPSTGVSAVVANLTVATATAGGFLSVFPADTARPLASSINFQPGASIANLVVTRVSSTGKVQIYNSTGATNVILDVVGYFTDRAGVPPSRGALTTLPVPQRAVDTRTGVGTPTGPLGQHQTRAFDFTGVAGVPSTGVAAVVLNLISTHGTAASFFTPYPYGTARPNISTLNWSKGQTVNNYVVAMVGPGGLVDIYNSAGSAHVVIDVVGWYAS